MVFVPLWVYDRRVRRSYDEKAVKRKQMMDVEARQQKALEEFEALDKRLKFLRKRLAELECGVDANGNRLTSSTTTSTTTSMPSSMPVSSTVSAANDESPLEKVTVRVREPAPPGMARIGWILKDRSRTVSEVIVDESTRLWKMWTEEAKPPTPTNNRAQSTATNKKDDV